MNRSIVMPIIQHQIRRIFRTSIIFVPAVLSGCASATLGRDNNYALNIFSGKSCSEVYSSEYGGTVWDKCWWNQNALKIVFWLTVSITVAVIYQRINERLRRRVTDRLVAKYKEYLALERRATDLRYKHNALLSTREAMSSSVSVTFFDQCLKSQLENDWARCHAVTAWYVLQKEAQRSVIITGDALVSAMNKALSEDPEARFRGERPMYGENEHRDHFYWLHRDLRFLVLAESCSVEEKVFLTE